MFISIISMMDVFNILISHYLTFLIVFLTSILMTNCGRKSNRKTVKPTSEEQQHPPSDPDYDDTQENVQTVELQEDPLANVRLLTPTLPGGCNDENAAKEAATRHKTNQYFPKLQLQNRRITNSTTSEQLRRMVDQLPPHPPEQLRTEIKEPALEKRREKWKNAHVTWHEFGLVFLVRSYDPCRSKDEGVADTIDSISKEDLESTKLNSEMPMSDKNGENNKTIKAKEKTTKIIGLSRKSGKDRKLAATQEESKTAKSDGKTPRGKTPKTPEIINMNYVALAGTETTNSAKL